MKITGAELIISMLEAYGVNIMAGIPGGSNLSIYDRLRQSSIRHILSAHEQGAGFFAQGISRSDAGVGVCLATSGPGATNLATVLADAMMDSVPLVAITGQVSRNLLGTDAFQEIDTFGMTIPLTRRNYLVKEINELPEIIAESFHVAATGRKGPVLIDIPRDIQNETIEISAIPEPTKHDSPLSPDDKSIRLFGEILGKSKRPLILAGAGVNHERTASELRRFVSISGIPVVSTFRGMGSMKYDDPLFFGMGGMHGSAIANMAMAHSDLIIALGARFDDRLVGNPAGFTSGEPANRRKIVHVETDPAEIGKILIPDLAVSADTAEFLKKALNALSQETAKRIKPWTEWLYSYRESHGDFPTEYERHDHPASIIRSLGKYAGSDTFIVTDVGQHQMWTAQAYPFQTPGHFITSGGLGTMGFGLPAAMGSAATSPGKHSLLITGDGSFLMNIQELAVLARERFDVKIIVMDNSRLGMVSQQQHLYYEGRLSQSEYMSGVDYASVARGFGIPSYSLEAGDDISRLFETEGPALLHMRISPEYMVYPAIPPGGDHMDMIINERGERMRHNVEMV